MEAYKKKYLAEDEDDDKEPKKRKNNFKLLKFLRRNIQTPAVS